MMFLDRLRILFAPQAAWRAIADDKTVGLDLVHVAALAILPALARFAGDSAVGVVARDGALIRVPVPAGLLRAAIDYALALVVVAVVALVAHVAAPWFGGRRSLRQAFKLVAYSFTPWWLAGLFWLLPGLRFLGVFGLYGFVLAWSGLPHVMQSPGGKSLGYALVLLVAALAMIFLSARVTGMLLVAAQAA